MRKFGIRRFSQSFAVALLSLIVGMWSGSARSAPTVRIGAVPFYSSALVYVAQDKGFWKDSGLNVQIVNFLGGPLVNEALLGGGIDVGMGVGAGPAVALASRGAGVAIIAGEAYDGDQSAPPDRLMVAHNSPIKNVKELDGKPVAVHAKGSISYVMLEAIAKSEGIKPIVLEIPAPDQLAALQHGDVVAAMAETPFPEQMIVEGGHSIYDLPNAKVASYMQSTVTVTTDRYAQDHPDVVEKILAVEMRTARWIMDHRTQARDIITSRLKYKPEVVRKINPNCYAWSRNALFLTHSIHWWGREMKELGLIQNEPDYAKYFVTKYAQAAAEKIGRQPDPGFDSLENRQLAASQ